VSVAVNCSTATPDELVALQPVQLVSIAPVPGVIETVPLDELAAALPPEHPASTHNAGIAAIARSRRATPLRPADLARKAAPFRARVRLSIDWGKISIRTPVPSTDLLVRAASSAAAFSY
jgi:hypothetical protein